MAVLEVDTLGQEWVFSRLKANPTVEATVKGTAADPAEFRIYPTTAPTGVHGPLITHNAIGWRVTADAFAAPTQWAARWVVRFWQEGWDLLALRPLVVAALGALVGPDMQGVVERFVAADGSSVLINAKYGGPEVEPPDEGSAGVWYRVAYAVTIEFAA